MQSGTVHVVQVIDDGWGFSGKQIQMYIHLQKGTYMYVNCI
jgi:hypothetical protein